MSPRGTSQQVRVSLEACVQDYSDCDPNTNRKRGAVLLPATSRAPTPTPPPGKKVYTCLLNVPQQDFSPDLGHCRALSQVLC